MYKIRTKMLAVLSAVGLAGMILSGCGSKQENKEVHIGYFNNVTHAQALYMKAQGSLEDAFGEEVNVTWTSFNAGPAEVEALFAGQIDIGYIGPVPAITANVKSDGDVTILSGATMAGAELITSEEAAISKVGDLDGKTVAIPQIGNTQHLCLLKLLADYGLETVENGGTVTVTAVENADVQNMMDQGNIDAALVPEPWGARLVAGGAKIVLDYDEVYKNGDYPVAVVVVRNDFLKENPDETEKFLQEHEKATREIQENLEAAAQLVNDEINQATGKSLSGDILKEAFSKIVISTDVNEEAIEDFAAISLEQGFIEKSYDKIFAELD